MFSSSPPSSSSSPQEQCRVVSGKIGLICVLLLLLWTPTETLALDCGCPSTCTAEKMQQTNGAPFTCEARVAYFMGTYGDSTAKACSGANAPGGPCPDDCNPEKCVKPPKTGIDCNCPSTCTPDKLQQSNGASYTCGAHINYLMGTYGDSEDKACKAASGPGNPCPNECNPEKCKTMAGGLQTKPAPPPPSSPKQAATPPHQAATPKSEPVSNVRSNSSSNYNFSFLLAVAAICACLCKQKKKKYHKAGDVYIANGALSSQTPDRREMLPRSARARMNKR